MVALRNRADHYIFAALNKGRHLCSAGRPSRWALAHILVLKSSTNTDTSTFLAIFFVELYAVQLFTDSRVILVQNMTPSITTHAQRTSSRHQR